MTKNNTFIVVRMIPVLVDPSSLVLVHAQGRGERERGGRERERRTRIQRDEMKREKEASSMISMFVTRSQQASLNSRKASTQ